MPTSTRTPRAATVRLDDIARRANVSPSLVSRILNGKPGAWASDEVRERILATAREMNYRPHAAARALGSGKTFAVALPFFTPEGDVGRHGGVVSTLARMLGERGYHLVLDVATTPERIFSLLLSLATARACDAVVFWGDEASVEEQVKVLEPYDLPFVAKGHYEETHPHWPQAEFAHDQMMTVALAHLTARGQRRIAFLGHRSEAIYARKLRDGFRSALRVAGCPVSDDFVAQVTDREDARAQMQHWLRLPPPEQPTGLVIATGDEDTWQGVEVALAQAGRRIGYGATDVTVTGLRHTTAPLLYGEAEAFPDSDLASLAEAMCERLLLPLLEGGTPDPAPVRVLPSLCPVPSLGLPL